MTLSIGVGFVVTVLLKRWIFLNVDSRFGIPMVAFGERTSSHFVMWHAFCFGLILVFGDMLDVTLTRV